VRMIGFFSLGSALGNMFGAMLGGPLLALSGIGGLQGWQWVFFSTGFPAIALTFAVLAFLPSTPATAKFLSSDEKTLLLGILDREKSAGAETGSAIAALWDPKVIGFSAINFFMATGLYCVSYWLPTIVKSFGVTSTVNGLLNMIPWGLAAVMLVSLPFLMRTDRAVLRGVTLMTAFGAICFVASTLVPGNWTRFTCVVLGTPVLSLMYPCFWSLPPRFFSGARAAASIAVINSVGNLGGFFAQNLDPWISTATGSMIAPMLAPAVCLIAIGAAAFVARRIMIRPRPLIADAIPVH
jgi:MFS family permease